MRCDHLGGWGGGTLHYICSHACGPPWWLFVYLTTWLQKQRADAHGEKQTEEKSCDYESLQAQLAALQEQVTEVSV